MVNALFFQESSDLHFKFSYVMRILLLQLMIVRHYAFAYILSWPVLINSFPLDFMAHSYAHFIWMTFQLKRIFYVGRFEAWHGPLFLLVGLLKVQGYLSLPIYNAWNKFQKYNLSFLIWKYISFTLLKNWILEL